MRRERGWLLLLSIYAAAGGFLTVPGFAQDAASGAADPATTSSYDAHIEQALQAYDSGRWAEARNLFRRAHELSPTARTLRTIGMCSFNLGDYVDAVANLDAALQDTRKPLSPDQRANASELIARSQAHVGRFRLRLQPEDAVVLVDGRPPLRLGSGELLLEPGRRELAIQASGYQSNRNTLQVDGGDRTTLEIRLDPSSASAVAPAPAVVAATSSAPAAAPEPAQAGSGGGTQAVLGYVSLGLAGASLVAFGISTGLASSKGSTLEDSCPDSACGPQYHDDVDTYDRLKVISTATLIAGCVFGATGALLLLTKPADAPEHARLTPLIGLGSIGIRGQL